jgi:hypothetical protein
VYVLCIPFIQKISFKVKNLIKALHHVNVLMCHSGVWFPWGGGNFGGGMRPRGLLLACAAQSGNPGEGATAQTEE